MNINRLKFRITQQQIDTLKILETDELFQDYARRFREKFNINISTGDVSGLKLEPMQIFEMMSKFLYELAEKFDLSYELAMSQIFVYMKYNKWGFDPSFPKKFLEPCLGAPVSWHVHPDPIVKMGRGGKIIEYAKTINLVAHARLTAEEEKEALKLFREYQKKFLDPKFTKQKRRKKNLDEKLVIFKRMSERVRKHKEVVPTSQYLATVKKQHERGILSELECAEAKRKNPHGYKVVSKGLSSADIASKYLGGKKHADSARQISSRLNREKLEKLRKKTV